jgi:hypothetical protein
MTMYETVRNLWKQYCTKYSAEWAGDDPRHDLSAEVRERLTQLDLVLEHLTRALALVAIDPEQVKRDAEWFTKAQPRLACGEITEEEFAAGLSRTSRTPEESRDYVHAWGEVRLFTEIFYLVAWRLLEAFNNRKPEAFPNLRRIKSRGIGDVRNLLIEHPEHRKPMPNYRQWMVVTDDGPVLKSSEVLVRGGRVSASDESLDRGLYVNADELRREMEACLGDALGSGSGAASASN